MISTKLCFYFRYTSHGEGYYQIIRIELSPKIIIPSTTLFHINDEKELPFEDFKLKYRNHRIEGTFRVVIANQNNTINPVAIYASQNKSEQPGAITDFQMPVCIDFNIKDET